MGSLFRSILSVLVLCLAGLGATKAFAAPSADPLLNARGRAILDYFQALQAAPQVKLISGQFCGFGPGSRPADAEKIFRATGRWPAMISVDYTDFGAHWIDTHSPNRIMLEYWRAGGLVGASVHLNNPSLPEGGGLRLRGVKLADLLVDGTAIHTRWLRQLDDIAAGLQELQSAGVVVLWRPFHEMNGDWFWWGRQPPADLIAVWQQMFDYFTQTKGLHNLLWVYGPNHGEHTADYYPGDHYVDLVGIDAYTDLIDPNHIQGYPEISRLNKPFGFSEFGPHGAADPPGDYDYRKFLDGVVQNFPRSRFFLSWDTKWNPAENKFAREFYQDDRVITRESLPAGLAGPVNSKP